MLRRQDCCVLTDEVVKIVTDGNVRRDVCEELISVPLAVDMGEDTFRWRRDEWRHHWAHPADCLAMNASISSPCQAVTDGPSLNGFGKSGLSRTQRQTVAALTGNMP